MSKLLLELSFPCELQFPAATAGKEDDVQMDKLHVKIDRSIYDAMRREQQLVVDFEAFPGALSKLLNGCSKDRATQAAVLVIEGDLATLHIVCKMEHKIVELLSCAFRKLSDSEVRATVQRKFRDIRQRAEAAEAKVVELTSMMRSGKVPSLFHKNGSQSHSASKQHHGW